jgi:ABC-type antimicrobial peptide transport system permease subunit
MNKNKFSKYLLYAIGEIVLVVIGILIAVQINNWNTNKNEITRLNSILNIVKADLIKDTLNILRPLELYEEKNTQILNILENDLSISSLDTITELNNKNYNSLRNLITTYDLFQMQNKGISLLKNIATNIEYEKDTLITSLINSHSEYKLYFDEDNKGMTKLNDQIIEDYEKQSWFTDWLLRKYNQDMYHYFYNDEFKRKAGRYRMYSNQFLRDLKEYDSLSKTYITIIEKRLK